MGQEQSKKEVNQKLFGDKTVANLNDNFQDAKRKSKKRRKEGPSQREKCQPSHPCHSQPIFEKPMCIISTNEAGQFSIDEEVLRQIQQINLPLVIISIVGLYRTGKSYLMNCLAGKSEGFALGNTTAAKTKGIWAWCVPHRKCTDTVLMLLDTEGLGDISKGDIHHDNKICTLTLLLCNVLVYNIKNVFDQDAVEKLTFMTEMSKNIRFTNEAFDERENDQRFDLILPSFVLCLRDLSLKLEVGGKTATPDEYLDDCLKLVPSERLGSEKYNKPRECITKQFPERRCFTFVRPCNDDVTKLDQLSFNDLAPRFREDTEIFVNYIDKCKPKQLYGSPVTGPMFVILAKKYTMAIKEGVVPDVDDAFRAVSNSENERLAKEAVAEFKHHLEEVVLPIPQTLEFSRLHEKLMEESLENFRKQAVFMSKKFEDKAKYEMDQLWVQVQQENIKLVEMFCENELNKVTKTLEEKIQKRKYHKNGGHEKYKHDKEKAEKEFYKSVKGVDEHLVNRVICSLQQKQKEIEDDIMHCDKKIRDDEFKRVEKERADLEERQKKLEQEHKQAEEKYKQDFDKKLEEMSRKHQDEERRHQNEASEHIRRIKDLEEEQRRKKEEDNLVVFKLKKFW